MKMKIYLANHLVFKLSFIFSKKLQELVDEILHRGVVIALKRLSISMICIFSCWKGSVSDSRDSLMVGGHQDNLTGEPSNCSCPVSQSDTEVWAKFIMEEVSIPLVGSVGLLGILAAIVVLSHPDMKSTFHQSLITLAVFEILFLLSGHACVLLCLTREIHFAIRRSKVIILLVVR